MPMMPSQEVNLPPEIDIGFYRRYPDLADMSPEDLVCHFEKYGTTEGRVASKAALREYFLEYPANADKVLEIGPFCNPCIRGENVKYFDVLSTEGLRSRAEQIGYPVSVAPEVDFVSLTGDLSIVDEYFSALVSSHCIEHQPDLIKHINDAANILSPNGRYYLIIPDKRYCFDHFLPDTTVADIIEAHFLRRRTHRLSSIIEHRALTTHNDPNRHWQSDHADADRITNIALRTQEAVREFTQAKDSYIDVHAWKFTPTSFKMAMATLKETNYINLVAERVYQTPRGRSEFTAVLKRPSF